MSFDIVISSCKKDQFVLHKCVESIRKYVKDFRRIIVVSREKLIDVNDVEWFNETNFPFSLKDIFEQMYNFVPEEKRRKKVSYINQLIKLYAHKVIPNLTDNILICDSDIIFIRDTFFIENNIPLYGDRIVDAIHYQPYFNHHLSLCDEFKFTTTTENNELKSNGQLLSGICHHIIYNKYIINELIERIENIHGDIFWKIYLNLVDTRGDDISQYKDPANCELYYNYVKMFHIDKIKLRKITWLECAAEGGQSNLIISNFNQFEDIKKYAIHNGHNYIAFHSYDREIFT